MTDEDKKKQAPEEKTEEKKQPKIENSAKKPEPETKETPKLDAEKQEKPAEKKDKFPKLESGQKVRVHQKITEGKKERVQIFEGVIIAMGGGSAMSKTITVRKVSEGISVEKIFPLRLPTIEKIEVISKLNVRQAKLYYLRDYKKKIKERKTEK